ncbi:hypothetical protein swp_3644 [Shewanella piezotolerans WP3]|uniref:Uncharacterized protein n=1 Tax=Shewanella piezotolerans (strain WP3 / JCM 13877) TaxID=225849 RepID=B8CS42_SHEPW|nr:hypothetical protein swp_3644 [Shewanella piezotolerans WP3]
MHMVSKAADFSTILINEDEPIATPFRAVYEDFRR